MDDYDRQLEEAETQANEYMSDHRDSEELGISSRKSRPNPTNLSRHPTHVHRWETQVIQHTHTVGKSNTKRTRSVESRPLPDFGAGKQYPPEPLAEREAYVVDFNGPDDILHPQNWPRRAKLINFFLGVLSCLTSSLASSVLSEGTGAISNHFGVSVEVGTLLSTLYLCGYGTGPSIWAPVSELRGRKLTLVLGNFGFGIFAVGVAVAKDIQTLMICRFFMGVFGSSPLVVVAAMFTDMYKAETRGVALTCFCGSVFMGPLLGPIVGSFTVASYLGWRWCSYWSMIMGFTSTILLVFFLKETYPPTILVSKADYLRRRTKNWAIHGKQEEIEIDLKELVTKNLSRPLKMTFQEPILLLIGIYITFVYTLLYISITAYPEVFQGVDHWRPGVASLPFLGMVIGVVLAAAATVAQTRSWVRKYHANGNRVEPEWRLPFAAFAGVIFAIGLFWFGWTGNYKSVHWIVPTIGGAFIGFGIVGVFVSLVCYIMDAYLMFAASALGGNTILRSFVAAGAPLYDRQLFNNVGIEWGMTLLGCLAVILIPVPVLFMKYGPRLRQKSTWAPYFPATPPAKEGANDDDTLAGSDSNEGEKEAEGMRPESV